MATTITPNRRPDHSEIGAWPTLDRDPATTTHEPPDPRIFDPTRGRKIGSHPRYLTRGRKIGSDPYDDPTRPR